ncbi:ABC transporter permease [Phytohabitans suffuscus]|uniref:ABC transporter permease n=1 Tax=Phytohabitans suffuscus TaxID=624315 RepID=A0A6F8YCF2_9ACTN|nr:ABC transporter permease [Phytohabitans suffuscus]BCB83795.1 ABC transporter permease [Phytohabitans suffuscus]
MRTVFVRLLTIIPLVLLVVSGTFFLSLASNVDPAEIILGGNATQEQIDQLRHEKGLDQPALERYGEWLGGVVRGDLGTSIYTGASVTDLFMAALPVTLSLTVGGLLVGVLLGVGLGLLASVVAGSRLDRGVILLSTVGQAAPSFFIGMLIIYFLALKMAWFPATGYVRPSASFGGWLHSLILPSLALGVGVAAALARQARSSMIIALQQDYTRTALSKGHSRRRVVFKHAARNAASPVVTSVSFQVAHLLGGAIVIERLFALPGLGSLTIDAVLRYDPNVIQAVVLFAVVVVVLVNLLVDVSYTWLNPKVRAA